MENKTSLFGMNLAELSEVCTAAGQKPFVAKQLAMWLYKKNISDFEDMSNISKDFRKYLCEHYNFGREKYSTFVESTDHTRKYLYNYSEGLTETAVIPDEERYTICVSSQSGCKFSCAFCATGKNGFRRNLSSGEILNQLYSVDENEQITNIVFMGMGEPLDNFDQVMKCLEIITAEWGRAMSPTRITVSSIGIPEKLQILLSQTKINIAISLHNPFSEERATIVPAEKTFPIKETVKTLKNFVFTQHRRLTFEYIVLGGINHSYKYAKAIHELADGLEPRINLIAYNPINNSEYKKPTNSEIDIFKKEVERFGFICTIRKSKGQDIDAACGMLAGKNIV